MLECFKNYLLTNRGLVVVHLMWTICLSLKINFTQWHGIYCNKLVSFTVYKHFSRKALFGLFTAIFAMHTFKTIIGFLYITAHPTAGYLQSPKRITFWYYAPIGKKEKGAGNLVPRAFPPGNEVGERGEGGLTAECILGDLKTENTYIHFTNARKTVVTGWGIWMIWLIINV